MSQINVNIVAPVGFTGNLPGDNNFVQIVDVNGDTILKYPGSDNLAIGKGALESNTTGLGNTAIGANAYNLGNGISDVAVGQGALKVIAGGSYANTAVGTNSFFQMTSATTGNTGVGTGSGEQLLSGDYNSFLGFTSGSQFNGGNSNTIVGSRTSGGGTLNSGNQNTFVGTNSCWNFGGGNGNVYVGAYDLLPPYTSSQSGSNNILIGKNAMKASLSASNSITLGNSSHTVLRCNVTSITSLSDARDKKDVAELSAGLDFVKGLKPVTFTWNDRDEEGKKDIKDFGFIAQDLKKSQEDAELAETLNLVYEENPEKLEASYGKLIPILVKAIQDLAAKVEILESK